MSAKWRPFCLSLNVLKYAKRKLFSKMTFLSRPQLINKKNNLIRAMIAKVIKKLVDYSH